MKHLKPFIILTCTLILATGCIKENLDECRNVGISLIYTGDGNENIFSKKISQVTLYVFDKDEKIVTTHNYSQNDLKGSNTIERFRLKPAEYTVVALCNNFSRTAVVLDGIDGIKDAVFTHNDPEDGYHRGHDANYIGSTTFTVPEMGNVYPEIILKNSHTDVHIEVSNTGTESKAAEGYTVVMKNIPSVTTFENTTTDEISDYHPNLVYDKDNGKLVTNDFNLFRLEDRKDISVDLLSAGEVIYSFTLEEFLNDNPSVDLTLQEAVLPISILITPVGIKVTIPEWYIVDVNPEF